MTPTFYKIRHYISGSNDKKFNFYCAVYDENMMEIRDHPCRDNVYDQTWTKIQKFMRKAERKCIQNGLKRVA